MISYIKGQVEHIAEQYVIVDNQAIGYQIFVSPQTVSKLRINESVKIFTYMSVKEDGVSLFGFLTQDELRIFYLLIGVSGIGPKGGLAMLNIMSPSQITLAIITDDVALLSKAPGIGKKTAQKVILELKDKLSSYAAVDTELASSVPMHLSGADHERQDAIDALISLGYKKNEAVKAVLQIAEDGMTTEDILKLALKKMASR